MFKNIGLMGVFSLGIAATTAYAECDGDVRCNNVTVDRLYVSNQTFVGTSGTETFLKCTAVSNVYLKLDLSHPNYNQIFDVLHNAHNEQHRIQIRVKSVTNVADPCEIAYVVSDK